MKSEKLIFRTLTAEEITPEQLAAFRRRQEVMLCYRRGEKGWEVRPDPFTDDWTEEERAAVVRALQETARSGGFVQAALSGEDVKGFIAPKAIADFVLLSAKTKEGILDESTKVMLTVCNGKITYKDESL